jgi:hypothetical protein
MSYDYMYKKQFKDLVIKEDQLEEEILNILEALPSKTLLEKFNEYKEVMEKKIDFVEDSIKDLEWEHEDEIDDKEDLISSLESQVDDLESQLERAGLIGNNSTLDDEMKIELFAVAAKKYTLTQLEEKLGGNRFQLM